MAIPAAEFSRVVLVILHMASFSHRIVAEVQVWPEDYCYYWMLVITIVGKLIAVF